MKNLFVRNAQERQGVVRGLAEQLTEAYRDSQAEVAVSSVHPNYIPVNNQSDDGGKHLDDINSFSHSPSDIRNAQKGKDW